jgi:hypothetical protein
LAISPAGASFGLLAARALTGVWRSEPPSLDFNETEFDAVAQYLLGFGGPELLWYRIRNSSLRSAASAARLQEVYRYASVHVRLHESEIERVFTVLNDAEIPAILIKGWSVARFYPDPGVRPYVDIDLLVDPADAKRADRVLVENDCEKYFVELHPGPKHLDDQPIADWFTRSVTVPFGETIIRVPRHEDHLRALCVHWLHHGAVRAAGLCDIALFVERFGGELDWELCFRGSRQRAGWIATVVSLAHRLLGADITHTPLGSVAEELPPWIERTVLKIWDDPVGRGAIIPPPLHASLSHPWGALRELRARWPPNPFHATVEVHGGLNRYPRWPYQTANFLARTGQFLAKLPRNLFVRKPV